MRPLPRIALFFAAIHVLLHLATADNLGFHRDEFLYLALGRHLDWGFWSNGPFIGAVSWLSQHWLGDSLPATRVFPALAGGGLILLTGLVVRELGGGRFAQVVNGLAMLGSIAWLRAFGMLMPVPFDVLFWTLLSWWGFKWLQTGQSRWWWAIGITAGLGMLNKYSIVFWAAGLPLAMLLTPHRKALLRPQPWQAAGLALLVLLPNLWWQWQYNFPVVRHMRELAASQLVHVKPLNFLLDQILMQGPGGALLWLAGLMFLLRSKATLSFRLLGWHFLAVLAIFLALNGKSYYTLGLYPLLMAAGAVWWERYLQKAWSRIALALVVVLLALPLAPAGIPLWPPERLAGYFHWLTYDAGIDAVVRWEDGELHELPQDYADMLGWQELATLVDTAFLRAGEPERTLVYCENYGQAGAVDHLSLPAIRPRLASFSDSYRLWAPDTLAPDVHNLIYVNDELGQDVAAQFSDIQKVGEISHHMARERGTGVWLCRSPRSDMPSFWAARVKEVKAFYGLK